MKLPVIERDEAHFVQASRQMLQTGHLFQIRFQEQTRFQKPPGINWLQAFFVSMVGDADQPNIWPYRIPSILGAWISVLLTYYFASRLLPRETAFLGAAFLASSLLLLVESHMAVIDSALLCSIVLMQGALWQIVMATWSNSRNAPIHPMWSWIFWIAMALGVVLKGITPLVGFLTILSFSICTKRWVWLRELRWHQGGVIFVLITLAWLIPLNVSEHSNYLWQMIHRDLLPKLQGGHESHGFPPLYHLFLLPITFWPGSLFLWPACIYAYRHRYEKVVQFLLAWIVPTWLFFEIMPTKLPQYVLPTFPAIALLCSLAVTQGKEVTFGLRCLQVGWGLLSLCLALFLGLIPFILLGHPLFTALIMATVIPFMSFFAIYYAWHGAPRNASVVILILSILVYPFVFSNIIPALTPLWISKSVAEHIKLNQSLWVSNQYAEPGLVFYLNTKKVHYVSSAKIAMQHCNIGEGYALFGKNEYTPTKEMPTVLINGYHYSKGKWVELVLVTCNNARPGTYNQTHSRPV